MTRVETPTVVEIVVHREPTDDGVTWWADSEVVSGFTAAAESLSELLVIARRALADIAEEEGLGIPEVRFRLEEPPTPNANESRVTFVSDSDAAVQLPMSHATYSTRVLASTESRRPVPA